MEFGKDSNNINGGVKGRSRRKKPMGFGRPPHPAEMTKAPTVKKPEPLFGEPVERRPVKKADEVAAEKAAEKAENAEIVKIPEPENVVIAEEPVEDLTAAARAQAEAARAKEELAQAEAHAAKLREEARKAEERAAQLREEASKAEVVVSDGTVVSGGAAKTEVEKLVVEAEPTAVEPEKAMAETEKPEKETERPAEIVEAAEAQKKSIVADDKEIIADNEAPESESDYAADDLDEQVHKVHNMKKIAAITGAAVLGLCVAAGGAYAFMGQKYRQVYFPNTIINGIDASGLTVDQVKAQIASGMEGYALTLNEQGGSTEQIGGTEIDLHSEYDGTLEQVIAGQEPLKWGFHMNAPVEYTIETMMAYDKEKLQAVVDGLDCLEAANQTEPKNAYVSNYTPGTGYVIVPEELGTAVDEEKLFQSISDAILNLKTELSLEAADVYEKPAITAEDEQLITEAAAWNHYGQLAVTYKFGDQTDVLNGDTIHTWLTVGEDGSPVLDASKVTEYVAALAKTHNTAYSKRNFHTSYGTDVTISGGSYGWRINQKEEVAALTQILQSGESQEREPVYSQTAASHGSRDYGDTYVEINLTAQHLYYYKNGSLVVQSDFVSGNVSKGYTTPAGSYPLTYKQRDATLKGQGYASPVSYWMPFNGGIGMHDATWRSKFGGSIYKTNGSHGCINLPLSVAKTIFENISQGTPVLCYNLGGTGGSATTAASETKPATKATQAAQQATTAPAATAPAQTAAETTAAATAPAQNAGGPGGSSMVTPQGGSSGGPGAAASTQPAQTTPAATTAAPAQETTQAAVSQTPGGGSSTQSTPGGSSGQTQSAPGGSTGSQTQSTPGGSSDAGGGSVVSGPGM